MNAAASVNSGATWIFTQSTGEKVILLAGEDAYRQYAKWYNGNHPAKKISWRRLNWLQRQDAFKMFLQIFYSS